MAESGIDELVERALELSPERRAELASLLLASLEDERPGDRAQVDAAWAEEIGQRRARLLRGETQALNWDDVYADLRSRRSR